MRPSDITDGIRVRQSPDTRRSPQASMRPSDITDGITGRLRQTIERHETFLSFNEAVGYYRRNPAETCPGSRIATSTCFNEAVGYYRRNRALSPWPSHAAAGFNEAVGYYRRNPARDLVGAGGS